jgi:hypothetical protein
VAYAKTGSIRKACAAAEVNRGSVHYWRQADRHWPQFEQMALDIYAERLVEEADRRAVKGNRRYKFTPKGEALIHPVTGEPYYEDTQSDLLLMFRLKALRPNEYRERTQVEHTGPGGGPVEVDLMADRLTSKLELLAQRVAAGPALPQAAGIGAGESPESSALDAEILPPADAAPGSEG